MDTAFKIRSLLGLDPTTPAVGGLVGGSVMRWPPVGAVMRASDAIVATSRRILAEWSLSGADGWAQPRGTDDPGDGVDAEPSQLYPDDDWRVLGEYTANLTPGTELAAYAVASSSGIVHKQIPPTMEGDTWASDGAWAEVRVTATFTNGASTTATVVKSASIPGSPSGTYGGGEASSMGGNHTNAMIIPIGRLRPPGFTTVPATAAIYSEWSVAEITIEARGGWRGHQVVVHEQPLSYVSEHDNDGLVSVHGMPVSFAAQTPGPLVKAPDGATYEEHRFGTRRTAQVAERQSERLGPRIMHWTAWDESATDQWAEAESVPVTTTSTTFVHILDSTIANTAYDENTPGWIVAGSYAQLARLCDPAMIARGCFAAVPVRVTVDASRGASFAGQVRVQCGLYDWVDVGITGSRAIYTATGYLESQVNADHNAWPLVVWIRGTGGNTMSLWRVSVDFGTW